MRPLLHSSLVNGRYGDPALYVEMLFEKRALLFDLGDITFLPPRKAGEIARAAGARRMEPFHFSPRYEGQEEQMMAEAMAAFSATPLRGEQP